MLPSWLSADQLEEIARGRLTPAAYDYIAGGAGEELTLRENRAAFARLRLRPRVLTGVESATTETFLFGRRLNAPVLVSPMGGPSHELAWPGGVREAAAGAAAAGVGYMVSASSVDTLELPGDALVCQVYLNDRDAAARLVEDAERLGYLAACVTVDVPVAALRRRNLRHGVGVPTASEEAVRGGYANPAVYAKPATWADIEWLRSRSGLPLLVKGIMTAEDASLAVAHGVQGIVVSNHGARQLDGCLATIDALPEVAEAVAGRAVVVLDGGVRTSTDVALALALGAGAVGVGKAAMWALAAGGRETVGAYLGALGSELARTLLLLGAGSPAELGPAHVDRRFAPRA
ncbi:MAG: alpha-hydroxy-acid oxidizing protein [Chloroflexi bacterium]|nr:MAG: alpha-hydroxy-acid oxidizing protein [Chloroflexota bacterium]